MKIKDKLEQIGYYLFLQYDDGIQFEFQHRKDDMSSDSYIRKVLLLGKLLIRYRILKEVPFRKWEKMQKNLKYPEWIQDSKIIKHQLAEENSDCQTVVYQLWDLLAWTMLGSRKHQDAFLETVCQDYSVNECEEELYQFLSFSVLNQDIYDKILKDSKNGRNVLLFDQFHISEPVMTRWLAQIKMPKDVKIIYENEVEKQVKENPFLLYTTKKKSFLNAKQIPFPDVRKAGEPYRGYPKYDPVVMAYNTILNIKFHWNYQEKNNFFYGIGYKYGGILVAGICQWLNQIAKLEGWNRLIFISRDCDIIRQVYAGWFSEFEHQYLYISRQAEMELIFSDFPREYVTNLLFPKMSFARQTPCLGAVLEDLGLSCLKEFLKDEGLHVDMPVNSKISAGLIALFEHHKSEIIEIFAEHRKAGIQYLEGFFQASDNAGVIDLGWKATTFRYLRHLCRSQEWNTNLKGALLMASGDAAVQNEIHLGNVHTWLFENDRTANVRMKRGNPYNVQQVRCIETILTSPERSLTNYEFDEKQNVKLHFRDENRYASRIQEIHRGILDFQKDFLPFIQNYQMQISAEDAFEPLNRFLDNKQLVRMFLEQLEK